MANQVDQRRLAIWFTSDFGGCGHLRSLWINESLNSFFGSRKLYEGITTSRFLVDKNILSQAKVFHFQRQITNPQVDYIMFIRKYRDENCKGTPIIYDLDDNFMEIPDYNYAKPFFQGEHLVENLKRIVNAVDIVTVSTEPLATWIKSFNGTCKIKVVPNFIPKYIYRPYDFIKAKNKKPHIAWAGSVNHYSDNDMGDFKVIYDLILNTQDVFDWTLFGLRKLPKWVEHLNKIKTVKWIPIVNLPATLKSHNIDFGLAPLITSLFNESKSNIKLLDYGSSDIISVCSKLEPYKEADVFFNGDWKEDKEQILNIFNNEDLKQHLLQNQKALCNRYWLETNLDVYMKMFNFEIGGLK